MKWRTTEYRTGRGEVDLTVCHDLQPLEPTAWLWTVYARGRPVGRGRSKSAPAAMRAAEKCAARLRGEVAK